MRRYCEAFLLNTYDFYLRSKIVPGTIVGVEQVWGTSFIELILELFPEHFWYTFSIESTPDLFHFPEKIWVVSPLSRHQICSRNKLGVVSLSS
jgi:hypothetical protein